MNDHSVNIGMRFLVSLAIPQSQLDFLTRITDTNPQLTKFLKILGRYQSYTLVEDCTLPRFEQPLILIVSKYHVLHHVTKRPGSEKNIQQQKKIIAIICRSIICVNCSKVTLHFQILLVLLVGSIEISVLLKCCLFSYPCQFPTLYLLSFKINFQWKITIKITGKQISIIDSSIYLDI